MLFMFYISNFPYLFLWLFCLENVLSTGLYYGADKCVSHTSDVEGLIIFVVRCPSQWMNILRLNLFEIAIHFAHPNDHSKSIQSVKWSVSPKGRCPKINFVTPTVFEICFKSLVGHA